MIIKELESNPVEPVTLDEVKDYLGYAHDVTEHDDVLSRHIRASRQMLEKELGIFITQRQVSFEPSPGLVSIPSPVFDICSFTAKDEDGEDVDVPYEVRGTEFNRSLHWTLPEGYTDPVVIEIAGFEEVPEDIRTAIVDIVKAKYDRTPIAPILEDAVKSTYHYARVGL